MSELRDKIVAVTGASSGIGAATARAAGRAGAKVALAARRRDRVEEVAQLIRDEGGQALAIPTDVGSEDDARRFVERTAEELGGPDVLVNNAGLMLLGPVENADTDEWRRMIDVNVMGVLYCSHAVLPLMRSNGGGHIVNVASLAGRRAGAGFAVYSLTKFGIVGFSEGLRQEALAAGVRVTLVEPGFVPTELQGQNNAEVQAWLGSMMDDIGEVLTPDDIAESILHVIASPPRVNVSEIVVLPTGQA